MSETRNKFLLGASALVFFSLAYALTLNTDASVVTGAVAAEVLGEKTTAVAIGIVMALAGALAGYFTFLRSPKKTESSTVAGKAKASPIKELRDFHVPQNKKPKEERITKI